MEFRLSAIVDHAVHRQLILPGNELAVLDEKLLLPARQPRSDLEGIFSRFGQPISITQVGVAGANQRADAQSGPGAFKTAEQTHRTVGDEIRGLDLLEPRQLAQPPHRQWSDGEFAVELSVFPRMALAELDRAGEESVIVC